MVDWDAPFVVSRSLTLEIDRDGRLVGSNSLSRPSQQVDADAVPILTAFASAATPREVLERLAPEDPERFEAVVESMVARSFLTPAKEDGKTPFALAQNRFNSLLLHHRMLFDPARVMSYRSAITRHCRGKVVAEIGCGTGILSIFAAQAGARRVIAVEESGIANLARRMFEANRVSDVVELRLGNSRDVEIDEGVDVVVHEILGVDPFAENILRYVDDVRKRWLAPGGRLLPWRLEVFAAGIELDEAPHRDREHMVAESEELGGLYGIDFEPYTEQLARLDPRQFLPPVRTADMALFEPKVLSEEHRLLDVDFRAEDWDLEGQLAEARLEIRESGTLDGVVLYFRAHLDETTWLSTSPFAPKTHWNWHVRRLSRQLPVSPGDDVGLVAEIESWRGRQRLDVDL